MTNYYIEKNNKIVLFDTDKQKLKNTLDFMPQYKDVEILSTEAEIIEYKDGFVFKNDVLDELLTEAKQAKYNEANNGAKTYLELGEALFELSENQHIEATDGNIGKLSAYALSYITGALTPSDVVYWNTKEDETITLTQEQLATVLQGLGQVQAEVWNVKFPYYLKQIEEAKTADEVQAIVIDYSLPVDIQDATTEGNSAIENEVTDG